MRMIPGTRVEDNALHRASLWLQTFQGTERGGEAIAETREDHIVELGRFIETCSLHGVSADELADGADFYGDNFMDLFGGRLTILVMTAEGPLPMNTILRSVWVDGLKHGVALRDGKRGLSNAEIASQ